MASNNQKGKGTKKLTGGEAAVAAQSDQSSKELNQVLAASAGRPEIAIPHGYYIICPATLKFARVGPQNTAVHFVENFDF